MNTDSRARGLWLSSLLLWGAACGSGSTRSLLDATGSGGTLSAAGTGKERAGTAGAQAPSAGSSAMAGGSAAVSGAAGAGMQAIPSAGSTADHAHGAAGQAGGTARDHCVDGEEVDAADATLSGKPDTWKASNGDVDLVVPKAVLTWMQARVWEPSHDAWHNVRRCRGGGIPGATMSPICSHAELIPTHQECADADDGYAFLVMHRHMLRALRQSFPQHPELFQGFPRFPYDATAVPEEWRGRWGNGWSQTIVDTAKTLEDIENKLAQFPTEGDLGRFIQCGGMASGASSIHGALHFKWVVNDSPYSLGKQTVNIDNHMFWKLHGWIDQIWERYRVAKGLTPAEPKLQQSLIEQCREMHALGATLNPNAATKPNTALPVEHGVFHEQVRPILEKICSSCHSESSPEAGMSLGGHLSSADIVNGLIDVPSVHGGQWKRVLPGNADQSWLYLKAAGRAMSAGCNAASCNNQVMPPTGQVTLTTSELDTIRQWIGSGAPRPTQ